MFFNLLAGLSQFMVICNYHHFSHQSHVPIWHLSAMYVFLNRVCFTSWQQVDLIIQHVKQCSCTPRPNHYGLNYNTGEIPRMLGNVVTSILDLHLAMKLSDTDFICLCSHLQPPAWLPVLLDNITSGINFNIILMHHCLLKQISPQFQRHRIYPPSANGKTAGVTIAVSISAQKFNVVSMLASNLHVMMSTNWWLRRREPLHYTGHHSPGYFDIVQKLYWTIPELMDQRRSNWKRAGREYGQSLFLWMFTLSERDLWPCEAGPSSVLTDTRLGTISGGIANRQLPDDWRWNTGTHGRRQFFKYVHLWSWRALIVTANTLNWTQKQICSQWSC